MQLDLAVRQVEEVQLEQRVFSEPPETPVKRVPTVPVDRLERPEPLDPLVFQDGLDRQGQRDLEAMSVALGRQVLKGPLGRSASGALRAQGVPMDGWEQLEPTEALVVLDLRGSLVEQAYLEIRGSLGLLDCLE